MKKNHFIPIIVAILSLTASHTYAQSNNTAFETISAGVGLSTMGLKAEVATPLSQQLTLRAGVSILPISYTYKKVISAEKYRDKISYDPQLTVTSDISFINGNLLLDYAPFESNMFHFTAGLFLGKNNINLQGALLNPKTGANVLDDLRKNGLVAGDDLPSIEFDNKYEIRPSKEGTLSGNITLGNMLKPYLGIGVAPTIPNERVGVKLDIGILYQGASAFSSPNMIKGNLHDWMHSYDQFKRFSPLLDWYPMINLQISFKVIE